MRASRNRCSYSAVRASAAAISARAFSIAPFGSSFDVPVFGLSLGICRTGGDEQFGDAHAVVEGLARSQSWVVNPPDRPLVPVREGGPQHGWKGQLPPHSSQLLLRGLEQLQSNGGRELPVRAAAGGDILDRVIRRQLLLRQTAAAQDPQDLLKITPGCVGAREGEPGVRDHLQ